MRFFGGEEFGSDLGHTSSAWDLLLVLHQNVTYGGVCGPCDLLTVKPVLATYKASARPAVQS